MFMYLELYVTRDGVHAKVVKRGDGISLGTETSRLSNSPFAVFQIAQFSGLANIDTDNLWDELFSRSTTKELWERIVPNIAAKDLMRELLKRTGEKNAY